MPIYVGQSTKNQIAISVGSQELGRVYVGDMLVWQKEPDFYNVKFGLLYNPYVIFDSRNLFASGWQMVNVNDIGAIRAFSGNAGTVGLKLKHETAWTGETTNTNEYKMNFKPSGWRNVDGFFSNYDCMNFCKYGTDTWRFGYYALGYNQPAVPTGWIVFGSNQGYSVRGRKTTTTLTHGQTGTYTGNDGKVYRTVCINNIEYIADALAETKFRTGEPIPEVTANAAWAAQITSAFCALNNDWNNVRI